MKNKKVPQTIVTVMFLFVIVFHFALPAYSPIYSCVTQNPKLLYYAICFRLENDTDHSFLGKMNSVVAGFNGYATFKPLWLNENYVKRRWIDLWGWQYKILDKRIIYNINTGSIVKLNNGYLSSVLQTTNEKTLQESCQNMTRLKKFLNTNSIPMLYIQFPHKLHQKDNEALPRGVADYSNLTADNFIASLRQNNIDVYDTRTIFQDDIQQHYQLFYYGDGHWKDVYAFHAFGYIVNILNQDYGMNLDIEMCNINKYHVRKVPFGVEWQTLAKNSGQYYSICDSYIESLVFDSPINIELRHFDFNKTITGTYQDVFADHGVRAHKIAINHNISNGKKLLLIKDSFAHPLFDYFSLVFQEVDMIDLRLFRDNVFDYIKTSKPDMVIVAYNPHMIVSPRMFDFEQKLSPHSPKTK